MRRQKEKKMKECKHKEKVSFLGHKSNISEWEKAPGTKTVLAYRKEIVLFHRDIGNLRIKRYGHIGGCHEERRLGDIVFFAFIRMVSLFSLRLIDGWLAHVRRVPFIILVLLFIFCAWFAMRRFCMLAKGT